MTNKLKPLRVILSAALCLIGVAAIAAPAPHVRVDLLAGVTSAGPGESFDVLLHQDIDEGWHTYWHNPGDSGDAPSIQWQVPEGVTVSEFRWPYPERIAYGPLMNFGYHDEVYLPFTVTVPADYDQPELTIEGKGRVLVCEDICIPEKVSVTLTVAVAGAATNQSVSDLLTQANSKIPAPLNVPSSFAIVAEKIALHLALPAQQQNRVNSIEYFPYAKDVIENPAEQTYRFDDDGLTLILEPGYAFDAANADLGGVLVIRESSGNGELVSSFSFQVGSNAGATQAGGGSESAAISLWLAIALAFAGGLILNLMPCVFPVLSIKILSLVDAAHESGSSIRLHGWTYAAGVILSFVGIALALILLRMGGEAIGWGFQLQSPVIVGLLAYLFLLIGLNLLGVFEVGLSLMSFGGGAAAKGYGGSFATGVLATLVAAPCTAPFMGAAVGYALTQSPAIALVVFAALGAGMAAPYLLLCYSPALLRRLPAPGNWMVIMRQAMAFPMFASAIWLLWVLGIQAGVTGMMQVLAGSLTLAFAVWLVSLVQVGSRSGLALKLSALLLAAGAIYAVLVQETAAVAQPSVGETAVAANGMAGVYSEEALAAARQQGPVLVNFTAAWCITCKVNEINALNTDSVKRALEQKGITYLKGDWTNEDPLITRALQSYGRSGVPLYLLYRPGQERAEMLPQILTEGIVLDALNRL